MSSPQRASRLASFHDIQTVLYSLNYHPIALVQEYDESTHKDFERLLNVSGEFERNSGNPMPEFHLYSRVIGHYYAPKRDHMLYAADFVAYYFKIKGEANPGDFKKRLLVASPDLSEIVIQNVIFRSSIVGAHTK